MTRRHTSSSANGSSKLNQTIDAPGLLLAASVDAGGHFAATAPDSSPATNRAKHDKPDSDLPEMYPTDVPLPDDPGIFVDEIHEVVDLQQQWVNLLRSKDEKIRQRAIERLTDMKYKGAHTADEEPRLILDLPRPTSIPPEHEN